MCARVYLLTSPTPVDARGEEEAVGVLPDESGEGDAALVRRHEAEDPVLGHLLSEDTKAGGLF